MVRIDEPNGDNSIDAAAMPLVMAIGLLNHCLPEQNVDGEAVDLLKPEIVQWLQDNCTGRWRFMFRCGNPEMTSDEDGGKSEATGLYYFLRFADQNEAFHCRTRWYNEAVG